MLREEIEILRQRQRVKAILTPNSNLYPPPQSISLKYSDGTLMHLNPKQKATNTLDALLVKRAIKIKKISLYYSKTI